MTNMHDEILSSKQKSLLPLVGNFSDKFGLVGGTAIALQLGHRRSIDFDLLTMKDLNADEIREAVKAECDIDSTLVDHTNELTIVVNGVKITFLKYPYKIDFLEKYRDVVRMPDLPTLASMKAFALGRRAKWKDYIDIYFILKNYSFKELVGKARDIFGSEFNEKLFREQLAYFNDIDYSEKVDYAKGFEISDSFVKNELIKTSLQKFG